jgi:hypothetical protein
MVTIGNAAVQPLTYAGIRGSLPAQLYRVRQPIWENSPQPSNYRQPIRNLIGLLSNQTTFEQCCGSGSRRAKITHKNRKKLINSFFKELDVLF